LLPLPLEAPFNKPLHLPNTVDANEFLKQICTPDLLGYRVEEKRLTPRSKTAGKTTTRSFHIADRKFGWITDTDDPEEREGVQSAKRLVETLLTLGARPTFTQVDNHVIFRFYFDVSSKRNPAYYDISTNYNPHSTGIQEVHVSVFSRHPPDDQVVKNVARLDKTLHTIFHLCGVPLLKLPYFFF